MRILVVGAGATGGYYGGRLLESGQDVTFLVRERRARELAAHGLEIRSTTGNAMMAAPPTVLAEQLRERFDLILLSCKAYDLEGAMESFEPAVGEQTMILPVLNGMRQLDMLDARFGPEHVLGGLCVISAVLGLNGRIDHLNDLHLLSYGERNGKRTARVEAIERAFAAAKFESRLSEHIVHEMWEKWVFIASCASITCLMRAAIGDIVAGGAAPLAVNLLDECASVAAAEGYAPRESNYAVSHSIVTTAGSLLMASMMRDVERGRQVEADHMIGDLIRRAEEHKVATPLLRLAYAHLKVYEARRAREASA